MDKRNLSASYSAAGRNEVTSLHCERCGRPLFELDDESGLILHAGGVVREVHGMELDDLFGIDDLESVERKVDFERMLATLSERDRRVVLLYAEGYTQAEIGERVGITQQRISQILANICKTYAETA